MIARSRPLSPRRAAPLLYGKLVAAARMPDFYRDMGVADTIEGRYEMIALHATLLLARLRPAGRSRAPLGQAVVDFMAADLDRSMRELGVGDLSVSRTMKRLGEGFYGRAAAYEQALGESAAPASLESALLRNVYGGVDPGFERLAALADYVRRRARRLADQPIEAIADGHIDFDPAQGGGK